MLISAAALAEKVLVFMDPAVTVKENYEFRRIYRKGKSAVSPQLVIYCQRNRRGHSRLGVSVSTKLGCAVVRNRVRRRIREIYRLNKAKMLPGYDLIVVARPGPWKRIIRSWTAPICVCWSSWTCCGTEPS